MYDVVSVGILVADAMAKPVTALPEKGKLDLCDSIGLYTGGNAATCAINVSKMGLKSAVLGMIGDDGFGRFMASELEAKGVATEGLSVTTEKGTSASLALISPDGERSFIHCPGANGVFREKDVNYDVIAKTNIVFVTGGMLLPSFDGEDCALFLKKCKEMGKTTAYDVCWDSKGRWMELVGPSMPYIDYFMPSYEEAVPLSGGLTEVEDICDKFLTMGPKVIVLKVGKKGCYIKTKEGVVLQVPTYNRIKAVDTTGAGDSFCSGFLAGLSQGWELEKCAKYANAVGTHCVMAQGASTGIKSMEEILKFMDEEEKYLEK